MSEFIEWMLIAAANYFAEDDEILINKFRRDMQSLTPKRTGMLVTPKVDTLGAMALFEALFPVKFAIFLVNQGLHNLCSSNSAALHEMHSDPDAMIMHPVVLIVVVVSEGHFDKTVMQPGKGAHVKGIDETLPGWLEASAQRSQDFDPHSVAAMTRNWNDR